MPAAGLEARRRKWRPAWCFASPAISPRPQGRDALAASANGRSFTTRHEPQVVRSTTVNRSPTKHRSRYLTAALGTAMIHRIGPSLGTAPGAGDVQFGRIWAKRKPRARVGRRLRVRVQRRAAPRGSLWLAQAVTDFLSVGGGMPRRPVGAVACSVVLQ
jgi:hypothetical protein